jgi:AraC-like DNA-binding protein
MSSDDAEQWVNVPDDFFKEPYRTVLNMGSDVQGGNNPFDPFLNTESSEDLDRAYLMLMGYSQAGKKGLAQGFFKFKDEKGLPKDRENLDITLNPYLATLPFVKKGFSLSQMSFDLKISERILSNYFNKELSKTFGEWKNDQRISYVCQILDEGKAKDITIEAISINAGFVSRSKFIDAFKERKGVTPSAYIKGIAEHT